MGGPSLDQFPGLQILRKLGGGASGSVFLAHQRDLDRSVAVKVLDERLLKKPEFLERFQREALTMAEAPHPGLVTIYASHLEQRPPYLILEYMAGGDLSRHAQAAHRLSRERLLEAGARVAEALAHLHERGILHRDVKPENLFWDGSGQARLGDLGLGLHAERPQLTETGLVVGTPNYMAPELFLERAYSPRTDVYSLAATLVQLASGQLPRTWPDIRVPVELTDEELGVPGLATPLMESLRLDPEDRLHTAGELATILRGLLASPDGSVPAIATAGAATATLGPEDLVPGDGGASEPQPTEPAVAAPPAPSPGRGGAVLALLVASFLGWGLGAAGGRSGLPTPTPARSTGPGQWVIGEGRAAGWAMRRAGPLPQEELLLSRRDPEGARGRERLLRVAPEASEDVGLWGDAHGAVVLWSEARAAATVLSLADETGDLVSAHRLEGTGWEVTGLDRRTVELARFGRVFRMPRWDARRGDPVGQRDP